MTRLLADTAPSPASARFARVRTHLDAADAAFGLLLLLGAGLVLHYTRGLSFFGDDWDFVLRRRGLSASVLLKPHGPHLSLVPILIYKVLLKVFGAGSYLPFRLLAVFDLLGLAVVLGWVGRARWGKWWGLAPVLLLVTLGPGGTSLLWSFQSGYAIALAAGIVALISAGRDGRQADLLTCGALIVSLASGSQGIGFVVGAAVIILPRRDWRHRLWVVAVPIVLYGLWYLRYGQQVSETHLSLWTTSLSYELQSLSATLAPLLGLSSVSPQTGLLDATFGVPLALAAIAALGFFTWRGWRPRPLFWGAAATLVVLWLAASLSNTPQFYRPPADPRYLSTGAVLVLVCLVTALRRPKLPGRGPLIVVLTLAAIAATNASQYSSARTSMYSSDIYSRAQLGALLIMRGVIGPQFAPATTVEPSVLVGVNAGAFFSAYDSFGVVSDSPAEIEQQDEPIREAVDAEMARGELSLGHGAAPTQTNPPILLRGAAQRRDGCLILGTTAIVLRAAPGRYEFMALPGQPLLVSMRRFASAYSVTLGTVPGDTKAIATVPSDRDPGQPWTMMVSGAGGRVCAASS